MKLLNYIVEANLRSLQPITHFKIHKRPGYKHLVWWKLSVLYGWNQQCEECRVDVGLETLCESCFEHLFCECGQRLEDSYGTPGDGFCVRCR